MSCNSQSYIAAPMQFLKTFIEPQPFRSTCYRAPNLLVLGGTTVRCKGDQAHETNRSIKGVLGYSLVNEFFVHMAQVIE